MREYIDIFGSILVMFFIFYLFTKWFMRIFEERLKFIEGLYSDFRHEVSLLVDEFRNLRSEVRGFISILRRYNNGGGC